MATCKKTETRQALCSFEDSNSIVALSPHLSGKLLLTNSGAREYLLFEAPRAMRKTMNDTAIMRVEWETVTGVLGPNLRGIFPPATDVTDVNSSCRSKDQRILATGDDFGHVKLFNYPVTVSFL